MRRLLSALAGAAILAATPAAADTCIRHNDIWNWSSINDKTLILENYRHQKFLVKMIGTCGDFKFHQRLDIRSRGATGLSCVAMGDDVITHEVGMRGTCAVTSVVPYVAPAKDNKSDANAPPHPTY
jgi:hypothetical protein